MVKDEESSLWKMMIKTQFYQESLDTNNSLIKSFKNISR